MNKYSKIALAGMLLGAFVQFGCTKQASEEPAQQNSQKQVQTQNQEQNQSKEESENSEAGKTDESAKPAETQAEQANSQESKMYRSLRPYEDVKNVPAITKYTVVRFETTKGNIDMEIYPEAAPNAAKRFVELVKAGFYNDIPVFRVVKRPHPFVAQFGINWRPGMIEWKDKNFNDDPCLFHLDRGTLAFAKAGPNTNSTQVFINYTDTDFLRSQNFTTFGAIVKGLEFADDFKDVGDPSMGLSQGALWADGERYLKSLRKDDQPDMIIKAYVVEEH